MLDSGREGFKAVNISFCCIKLTIRAIINKGSTVTIPPKYNTQPKREEIRKGINEIAQKPIIKGKDIIIFLEDGIKNELTRILQVINID